MDDEQEEEPADLYVGRCEKCRTGFTVYAQELMSAYPLLEEIFLDGLPFTVTCTQCDGNASFVLQDVTVIPFSQLMVMPPASGCPQCGREHHPETPHDANSLVYQYAFRNTEARAGREERWPTWADAMAHCTPQMQESWKTALRGHGVDI